MLTAKIVALAVLGALLGYLSLVFYTASFDITTWAGMARALGVVFIWVGAGFGAIVGSFK